MTKLIDTLVQERAQAWIETRRDIHRNPELGFTELRTAAHVAERLHAMGFEVKVGPEVMSEAHMLGRPSADAVDEREQELQGDNTAAGWLARMPGGQTGVVAQIMRGEGPVTAYRFDMDALPLAEAGEEGHKPVDEGYVSRRENVHHACGHDGHTAIGLGFAEWLRHADSDWRGTVKLVFQPAEEGGRGALPMAELEAYATQAPVAIVANFSAGVPLLIDLLREAIARMPEDWRVEITEAHHDQKKDAPSGTAKRLARVVEEAGVNAPPTHSIRAGDTIGEHTVWLAGPGERIELTHVATRREVFAIGALRWATWLTEQPPGLYRP